MIATWGMSVCAIAQHNHTDSLQQLIATTSSDSVKSATLNKLGRKLMFSEPETAQQYIQDALQLAELNNLKALEAYAKGNLGVIAELQSNYIESFDYFFKALSIADSIQHESLQVFLWGNLGRAYSNLEDYSAAQEYLQRELAFYQKIGAQVAEARDYLEQALAEKIDQERKSHLSSTYFALARLARKENSNSIEYSLLHKGRFYATQYQQHSDAFNIASQLSEYYAAKAQFDSAYFYQQEALAATDSLDEHSKQADLVKLQMSYELDKMQLKNLLLAQEAQIVAKESEYYRKVYIALLLGLLVAVVAAIYIGMLYWQKHKALNHIADLHRRIQQLNEGLQEQVEQRTQELKLKNRKLLDYAFVNSHRLRAPIANILGLLEVLTLDNATTNEDEKKMILAKLQEAGQELDEIVKAINEALANEERDSGKL